MITAITVLIILIVGYAHLREGLFTAMCMFVNVMLSSILTCNFYEPLTDWLDGVLQRGPFAGYEDFIILILLFSLIHLLLRFITSNLAPHMLDFPPNVQYGGALFGLITGYFLSGFVLCVLQTLPLHENFFGYQPRVGNDSGPRSIFPPDRLWLSCMRYASAYPLASREDPLRDPEAGNYDYYLTFDRDATFELRYMRYRRYNDNRGPLLYQEEFDHELYKDR